MTIKRYYYLNVTFHFLSYLFASYGISNNYSILYSLRNIL